MEQLVRNVAFPYLVTGPWLFITVFLMKKFSGASLHPEKCRLVGFVLIFLGAMGAAILQCVQGTTIIANLLSFLMVSFSSAVGGVYLSKGYLV